MDKNNASIWRVGIDCRLWAETGVGRYIRNIVMHIAELDRKNQYVLFMLEKDLETVELPGNFKKVKSDIRWHTFSEQTKLPLLYLREKLDLLFVPHFNVPVLYPKKFVATVHDLTILRVKTGRATTLPYPLYLLKRMAFRLNVWSTVHRAKKLFTVSKFVKEDLKSTFGIPDEKVLLTQNAVSTQFHEVSSAEQKPVLQKYGISKPYLFYVGNAHPHKNIERLICAFGQISEEAPDLTLVLGGKKEFFYERLEEELAGALLGKKIKFIGFIDDSDLPALYSGAEAFVNPSLYEGFGIQVLEAFACGTKVICSNTTSLPEVGGEAAFYFDPRDAANMAETVLKAILAPFHKKQALARVQSYSWNESAKRIHNAILNLCL